jgi:hypothetical protein
MREIHSTVLREVDLQHAKLGTLLAITAEAALLYAQNPSLAANNLGGFERVKQNIDAVQLLRMRYEEQRNLAERNFGQGDMEEENKNLANIRRLTIHVQEDIDKELRHVENLREQARVTQLSAPLIDPTK